MLHKYLSYCLIGTLSLVEVYSRVCDTEIVGEKCEPGCKSNCTNGYCEHPEGCVCNIGYTKRNDTCEPLCEGGCLHGTCVTPNTCRCDSGYNLVDGTCQLACSEPCENGTCTSNGTCECNDGYYKPIYSYPHATSCQPFCPSGCPLNGHCDAPGICKCNPGWRLSENDTKRCVALCRNPCGNGTCFLPDHCLCAPGFQVNNVEHAGFEVCLPICKDCKGSNCVAPNKCVNKSISKRSREDTTTTTKSPLTENTYEDYGSTTASLSGSKTIFTDVVVDDTSVTEEYNNTIILTSADLKDTSWMHKHAIFIWLPLIVIAASGLIWVLYWQRIPVIVINFFKRKSYNVQEAFLKGNGSNSYETLHFITSRKLELNNVL